ncbi:MAG: HPr family phosphocarrier protein, partial [Microbacteriaceae bacterium]
MTVPADLTAQATIRLTNSEGLHARPAAQFAMLASTFRS